MEGGICAPRAKHGIVPSNLPTTKLCELMETTIARLGFGLLYTPLLNHTIYWEKKITIKTYTGAFKYELVVVRIRWEWNPNRSFLKDVAFYRFLVKYCLLSFKIYSVVKEGRGVSYAFSC